MSSDPVFRRRRIVAERHIDGLGHVNNTVWVRFVVELADAHAEAVGMGFLKTRRDFGAQWIVRRHEIDYLRAAVAGEELLEETWVESLRGARSVRRTRFTRCSNGEACVLARTEWAFVTAEALRPLRVPSPIADAFPVVYEPESPHRAAPSSAKD